MSHIASHGGRFARRRTPRPPWAT